MMEFFLVEVSELCEGSVKKYCGYCKEGCVTGHLTHVVILGDISPEGSHFGGGREKRLCVLYFY